MKRLILGGIPCADAGWEKLFSAESGLEQKIIPFFDVFSKNYYNRNFLDLVRAFKKIIQDYKPDEIVLHDISVTLGLLALIKIKKDNHDLNFKPKIIIFNGAFRGFNVFKAPHPIRVQFMSFISFEREVKSQGCEIDSRFKSIFSEVCYLYRQVAISSIISVAKGLFKKNNSSNIKLNSRLLILASQNDPYIPFNCLELIAKNFNKTKLKIVNYGHFPYAGNLDLIRKELMSF